jgi:4-amino-4-deoxy-L-arabinose transferase-like glycosyltransferase
MIREPGMSLFLAVIYVGAGIENVHVVYGVQALLLWLSTLFFVSVWQQSTRLRCTFLFLSAVASPLLITIFSLYRESIGYSLLLAIVALLLWLEQRTTWWMIAITGCLLGLSMLTVTTLILLPCLLILLPLFYKIRIKHILVISCIAYGILGLWGVRNMSYTGSPCLTGCYRSALQWYVRGERAEKMQSITEPYQCLWSEYISRDWKNRSEYCSFNGVWHKKWPQGFIGVPEDEKIIVEGQKKILQNIGWYALDSLSEIIELHIPYVGPWGKTWNLLITLYTGLLYGGILMGIRQIWKREYAIFLLLMTYFTGIYILTDATPRYLLPILFCYIVCSAIGYTHLISTLLPLWKK